LLRKDPGTRVIILYKMRVEMTVPDISEKAIEKAKKMRDKVHLIHDDILNIQINQKNNSIFDRSYFHITDRDKRMLYILDIAK